MSETKKGKGYYAYLPSIDTLRFFAFLLILANHTKLNLALNGHTFFFTLTGFLISYISISEIKKNNHFNFRRYLARRFLRTLPLLFLIVALSFSLKIILENFFGKSITTGELWPFLLLIQNFFTLDIIFPLSNLWAMGVTEQYYLVFGILFFLVYPRWKWFGILFITIGLIINNTSDFLSNYNNYGYPWNFLVNFGIGNLLASICLENKKMFNRLIYINKSGTVIYLFGACILLIIGFSVSNKYISPFNGCILSSGYALIIFNVAFAIHRPTIITNIKWFQYLGKRTLGMYCWHAPVITILEKMAGHYNINYTPLFMFITTLVLVIPISILSYRYYESYFLRFKRRFN